MIDLVEQFLNKYDLLSSEKTLLVGFSGGADSTCLSDILYKLKSKYGFRLVLCHLNHNWRGEEAANDMNFCKNFAQKRGIEFVSKTLSEGEKHTETVARELRYEFFEKCIERYSADAFLLAHNKNDRAETLVYRLIKGTGVKGLASILENRDKFYRPLLNIQRKDIEAYCKAENLEFITDNSNFDTKYNRNYIRSEIMPMFEKINKNYTDSLNNLSELAEENESLVNEYLVSVYANILDDDKIITKSFLNLSRAVQKRIILDIFLKFDLDYTSKKIGEILGFVCENSNLELGAKISLTTDLWLFASRDYVEIIEASTKNTDEILINSTGCYDFSDYVFEIREHVGDMPEKFPDDEDLTAYIELTEPINFTLRTRRDGDIIQPLGMSGTRKLKKYLNSKRVKNHQKNELIFLAKNSEIYWAPLFGLNDKIKVVNRVTHVISLKKR